MNDRTTPKPSREFLIRAVEASSGGYHGILAYPGRIPEYVRDDDDRSQPRIFPTKIDAMASAGALLMHYLNDRLLPEPDLRFTHMSGGEFAVTLRELKITVAEFAHIYGTRTDRVHSWIDGSKEVPFPVWIIMEVLKTPGGRQMANNIVAAKSDLRKPGTKPRSMREREGVQT